MLRPGCTLCARPGYKNPGHSELSDLWSYIQPHAVVEMEEMVKMISRSTQRWVRLYRVNVAGALFYALLVLYEASTYTLSTPHAVGHVYAVLGLLILAVWSSHCVLLALPHWAYLRRRDRLLPILPVIVGLCGLLACWLNYRAQW